MRGGGQNAESTPPEVGHHEAFQFAKLRFESAQFVRSVGFAGLHNWHNRWFGRIGVRMVPMGRL